MNVKTTHGPKPVQDILAAVVRDCHKSQPELIEQMAREWNMDQIVEMFGATSRRPEIVAWMRANPDEVRQIVAGALGMM